jgi:hypothetical protein
MYRITDYTREKAKQLGVTVKASANSKKKIDVFDKNGNKLVSIGAYGMNDYPTYMRLEAQGKVPKGTANTRRKLYKERHEKDRHIKGSAGYYADKLLW